MMLNTPSLWMKRKKWTVVCWLILMICAVGLIVACQVIVPSLGNRVVTIKLSGWSASPIEQRLLQQVIQQFEQSHPTIRVKFEAIADQYMDVMKTRLIGDAAPDVFYLEAVEAPFLMDQTVLEPLEPYIHPDFDLADFEPNLLNLFKANNHLYGIPKDYSTLALFYNSSALAEAGVEPPQTWEALLEAAPRLTIDRNQDGRFDQSGFGMTPELARLGYFITAFNGQMVDAQGNAAYGSEAAMQGLQPIVDAYRDKRGIVQPADVGTQSGSEMFGQGKAAMVIEGNWAIPFLQDTFPDLKFGTAEVPLLNQRSGTMVYTVAYVMNQKSKHKREAWELIAYLTGKTGMTQWTSSGFALPTRRSVAEQIQADRDPLRAPLVAGVKYATPWQLGNYPAAVMNAFNNQFLSAMLGQQPLQQAIDRAEQDANRQIQAMR